MKITHPLRFLLSAFVFMIVTISLPSQASIITLTANIDGAQADAGMGTGSLGTGIGNMLYDDVSTVFSWDVSWSNLSGDVTVAHFHGPASTTQNAGVQVPISTLLNPTSGSTMINATQAADLLAGLWYINIHSTFSPGGEIRGQVLVERNVRVSTPAILSLVLLAMIGVFYSRRRNF